MGSVLRTAKLWKLEAPTILKCPYPACNDSLLEQQLWMIVFFLKHVHPSNNVLCKLKNVHSSGSHIAMV